MSNVIEFSKYDAELLRGKGLIVTEHEDLGIAIVRYHKGDNEWKNRTHGECDRSSDIVRKHRSVVYSLTTKLPLSVAPIRRIMHDSITRAELNSGSWSMTPYIDGTMINVFWNPTPNPESGNAFGWTLASRSKIHATCRFTSDKLFRDLFEEARIASGIEYSALDKQYSYTFVLVHPETRRIIQYTEPKIILVGVSTCIPYVTYITDEPSLHAKMLSYSEIVEEGRRISDTDVTNTVCADDMNDVITSHEEMGGLKGFMVTNGWDRVRFTTNEFDECVSLRGNTASRRTNHIHLMSLDPMGESIRKYIEWFPEERDDIRILGEEIKMTISELIENYMDRHVKKTKEHSDLPHWTRRPIWDLHGVYIKTRTPIREKEVFEYFRKISPSSVNRILKNRTKENTKNMNQRTHSRDDDAPAAAADAPMSSTEVVE